MDNDFRSFRRGTPKTLEDSDTQGLFNAVRQGMQITKAKLKKEKNEEKKYSFKKIISSIFWSVLTKESLAEFWTAQPI